LVVIRISILIQDRIRGSRCWSGSPPKSKHL